MPRISEVTLTEFSFDTPDIGLDTAAAGVGNMAFVKGNVFTAKRFAVKILTDCGAGGEYVANWVGTPASFAQACMLAPLLIGENPEHHVSGGFT